MREICNLPLIHQIQTVVSCVESLEIFGVISNSNLLVAFCWQPNNGVSGQLDQKRAL